MLEERWLTKRPRGCYAVLGAAPGRTFLRQWQDTTSVPSRTRASVTPSRERGPVDAEPLRECARGRVVGAEPRRRRGRRDAQHDRHEPRAERARAGDAVHRRAANLHDLRACAGREQSASDRARA